MIELNNVTLISVDCIDPETTVKALNYSAREIKFGDVRLLSSHRPRNLTSNIRWEEIRKLDIIGYSHFIARSLYQYVDTEFCLIIQNDGFVLNAGKWTNEFLQYDYIGAPWPAEHIKERVGNGGFSLRSRKMLLMTMDFDCEDIAEDYYICGIKRAYLEEQGIRFAPVQLAGMFSTELEVVECHNDVNNTFGFHGKWFVEQIARLKDFNLK